MFVAQLSNLVNNIINIFSNLYLIILTGFRKHIYESIYNAHQKVISACKRADSDGFFYVVGNFYIDQCTLAECLDISAKLNLRDIFTYCVVEKHMLSTHENVIADEECLRHMIIIEPNYLELIIDNMEVEDLRLIDKIINTHKKLEEEGFCGKNSLVTTNEMCKLLSKRFNLSILKLLRIYLNGRDFDDIVLFIYDVIVYNDKMLFNKIMNYYDSVEKIPNRRNIMTNIAVLCIDINNLSMFTQCIKNSNFINIYKVLEYIAKENAVNMLSALYAENYKLNGAAVDRMIKIATRRNKWKVIDKFLEYNSEYIFSYKTLTLIKTKFIANSRIEKTIINSLNKLSTKQLTKIIKRNTYKLYTIYHGLQK